MQNSLVPVLVDQLFTIGKREIEHRYTIGVPPCLVGCIALSAFVLGFFCGLCAGPCNDTIHSWRHPEERFQAKGSVKRPSFLPKRKVYE